MENRPLFSTRTHHTIRRPRRKGMTDGGPDADLSRLGSERTSERGGGWRDLSKTEEANSAGGWPRGKVPGSDPARHSGATISGPRIYRNRTALPLWWCGVSG